MATNNTPSQDQQLQLRSQGINQAGGEGRFGRLVSQSKQRQAGEPKLDEQRQTPPDDSLSPMEREILDLQKSYGETPKPARRASEPFTSRGILPRTQSTSSGRFAGQGPWEPPTQFSDEQREIINCSSRTIVAKALAGTGKTTTAAGFAARRKNSKILYMPFGKTVQLEAVKRFPPNTWCQTINSVAWEATSPRLRAKLSNSFTPIMIKEEMNLSSFRQGGLVLQVINHFMTTADKEFRPAHAKCITESKWNASESEAANAIAGARLLWRKMTDETDKTPIPHDALLKMWALTNPRLDYDYIIFDEAQDTNPVTAGIISNQSHAARLYIGDPHQSIYGFRGATNAMEVMAQDPSAVQLSLSQTWRFGPKVAAVANLVLRELKKETSQLIGMGQDGAWDKKAHYTKLSRTNAQLFRDAATQQGKGIHWAGSNGIAGYNINRINDAYELFCGRPCKDYTLRKFRGWGDLQQYAQESMDQEIKMLVSFVDEFRHDTTEIVKLLIDNEVRDESAARTTFTTAHKSKGLDWNYVELADDFEILMKVEDTLASDPLGTLGDDVVQEINLLYVALTRAKKCVQVNPETKEWIAGLEKFRATRNLAAQRANARKASFNDFLQRRPATG